MDIVISNNEKLEEKVREQITETEKQFRDVISQAKKCGLISLKEIIPCATLR